MPISSNQKNILAILADGQFHSGTDLANIIGISRSAICKQLNGLTELGIEFSAISGKGYRLNKSLQLLSKTQIEQYLTPISSGLIKALEIHDCIDSTNRYLVDKSQQSPRDYFNNTAAVCFSEYQTAGKGRRGREWVSPFGSNIYLSILWSFQQGPAAISGLSLAVGVAVIRALNECGVGGVGLKWPNDIYWQHRKLAGILIEVSGEAGGPCNAVVGLGLNFYLPEKVSQSITQDWVDLSQILVKNPNHLRNKFAAVLLNHLIPSIANYETDGLQNYLKAWRDYDCMLGKNVNIYQGKKIFSGIVRGIDDEGLLLLEDNKGVTKAFASGEVSFRKL